MTALFRVLGAMAAALLVIALSIFGLGDASTLTSPPEAVSEGFLREIVGGRYERALPYLGDRLRERVTADSLRGYRVRILRGMGEIYDVQGDHGPITGDSALSGGTLMDVGGARRQLRFLLERDNGIWGIAVLDQPAP
jgi:hypothetical protein